MSRGLDKWLTPIDYNDYLADDDNDDKDDDKATVMLGANDHDGRYHEDKSMTFLNRWNIHWILN